MEAADTEEFMDSDSDSDDDDDEEEEGGAAKDPDLAPVVDPEALPCVSMRQIDPGPVDFLVKCISGAWVGRFVHMNRKVGEIFGSDSSDPQVTMCLEGSGLSKKHAQITFDTRSGHYFLQDVGSETGTFLAVRPRRSVEIVPPQELHIGCHASPVVLELEYGLPISGEEEVAAWLSMYQLRYLSPALQDLGCSSIEDVRNRADELAGLVPLEIFNEAEDLAILGTALSELDQQFPAGHYERRSLRFLLRFADPELVPPDAGGEPPPATTFECSWSGGVVALAPGGAERGAPENAQPPPPSAVGGDIEERVLGVVPGTGWDRWEYLKFGYGFGKYFVHLRDDAAHSALKRATSSEKLGSDRRCFLRVGSGQRHWLQPQDVFRIGSAEFEVLRFHCGVHADQGRRPSMEDEDIVVQDMAISHWRSSSLFGIFDGHGGRACARFVRHNLHRFILESIASKGGLDMSTQVFHDIYDSLWRSFLEVDDHFLELMRIDAGMNRTRGHDCGSTGVVVCVVGGWVWCANCGDSRAALCRQGKALRLSVDHKPDRADEVERIKAAGGWIAFERVLGRLALTRAFGDMDIKVEPAHLDAGNGLGVIVPDPEIRLARLAPEDEFLLLGCDGLFEVFSTQEAVEFARTRLAAMPPGEQDPDKVARELVREAIYERGSGDNVTAMLVLLKRAIVG